ncbi:hypothetical protein SAMN05216174_1152 [Actinokineospora iranica]|uniref:Uncharacterized protein n=1 Tax=Actinokineospora iranica TaxID=1271860 RepID=A0A1G6WH73_9PSEU|nr:hypothetical protein SAMN05216174_1152 [Actinokineospora iranica]
MATEKAQAGIAAIVEASMQLDEAHSALATVTQGSGHPSVAESQGLLAEALQGLAAAQSAIRASIISAEDYAARL